MKRTRVALAAAAVFALGACGPMHPGAAIVVDNDSVSVNDVDDLADNLCEAVGASGQGSASGGDVRKQAASLMLTLTAARQVADKLDVDVSPSDYAVSDDEANQLEQQFPDADQSQLKKLIEVGNESNALLGAIGKQVDANASSDTQAQKAGQTYLQHYISKADVDIDPRYGLSDTGKPADIDTLSVKVSDSDDNAMPPSQQCGGQ